MKKAMVWLSLAALLAVHVGCINSPRFGDIFAVNPSIQTGNGNVSTIGSQGVGVTSEYKGRYGLLAGREDATATAPDGKTAASGKTAVVIGGDALTSKTIDAATEMELLKQLRGANAGTGSSQQTGNPQDNDTPSIEIPLTTGAGAAGSTAGSAAGGIVGKLLDKIGGGSKTAEAAAEVFGVTSWTCEVCKTVNQWTAEHCSKAGCDGCKSCQYNPVWTCGKCGTVNANDSAACVKPGCGQVKPAVE